MLEQLANFTRECAYISYVAYRKDPDIKNLLGHWERMERLKNWANLFDGEKYHYDFYQRYEDENFDEPTEEEYEKYALGIR